MKPRESSGRDRFILLTVAIVLLVILSVGLVALVVDTAQISWGRVIDVVWRSQSLSAADRFGLLTVEIAGATFLLAVLAAIIAILAFAAATRMPDVEPLLQFPGCEINKPIVSQGPPDGGGGGTPLQARAGTAGPLRVAVSLDSRNRWTAEHVMMRVRFVDMTLPPTWGSGGWDRDITTPIGAPVDTFELHQALDRVYGQILQRYWPLDFTGLRLTGQHPTILMWVAAHGGYLRIRKQAVTVE